MKNLSFALIGNQNCGKTTLFNALTGSNQHVGNFPGVTVEGKDGIIRGHKNAVLVDLPGIYSLSPYTSEEVVTRDFLIKNRPDAIINIVDATNLERNLYLTLQLIDLSIPMVLALNMMDEVTACGNSIDIAELSKQLGIPAVPISASRGDGVDELVRTALETALKDTRPARIDFCEGAVHRAIHSIAHIIEDHAQKADIPVRFAASCLAAGDPPMEKALSLCDMDADIIQHIAYEMEKSTGTDREAALADMRYSFIETLCEKVLHKSSETREHKLSLRIDRVLTHRIFAIPIFLLIMSAVFYLTFNVFGAFFSDLMSQGVARVTELTDNLLSNAGVNEVIHSLIIDGAFVGIGSVLSFLPTILVLFFFLSILEDTGYMARVAFVMDRLMRKIGLSGRSFVPMLIGFGCSVPAIMSTRTLSSERDRKMTILLTPFMSCSAKLPIYSLFTIAFFKQDQALIMTGLYVFGIITAILLGLLFKSTLFRGKPIPFVLELPSYRMPSARSMWLYLSEKAKDFMKRAFTLIFAASIAIWLLQSFDIRFNMTQEHSNSILALIGNLIAPIFAPLGFGDWRAATALLTGLSAKEAVVSTLAVLMKVSDLSQLPAALGAVFSRASALSFLVFTLLYMPCVAALAAIKRELSSSTAAAAAMAFQTFVAWIAAFAVYGAARLFGL